MKNASHDIVDPPPVDANDHEAFRLKLLRDLRRDRWKRTRIYVPPLPAADKDK